MFSGSPSVFATRTTAPTVGPSASAPTNGDCAIKKAIVSSTPAATIRDGAPTLPTSRHDTLNRPAIRQTPRTIPSRAAISCCLPHSAHSVAFENLCEM